MGGRAKPVVQSLTKPSSLAAIALGPLGLPIIGANVAGGIAEATAPRLPEPPEEEPLEQRQRRAEVQSARNRRLERREALRRQTRTTLTSPIGAPTAPGVSRTTLGGT